MLNERHALRTIVLDDGRVLDLVPLFGDRTRVTISRGVGDLSWFEGW